MVTRELINKIVEKQHLNGLTEQVRWNILDNKLTTNFSVILKDCIGEITTPFNIDDCELGIFDLPQFYKLVKIIKDPCIFEIIKKNDKSLKIEMKDSNFDLSYNLSDTGLISEGKLTNALPDPVVVLDINEDFINKFIKAHNALEKAETFQIRTEIDKMKVNTLKFIVGLNDKFSNKISFSEPTKLYSELPNFTYKVNNFREIISINKLSKITLSILSMGIMIVDIFEEDMKIKYWIVPNVN